MNRNKTIKNSELSAVEACEASSSASVPEDNHTEMADAAAGVFVQYDMVKAVEDTTRAAEEIRPLATKKAYRAKSKEFEEWAKKTFLNEPFEQRSIVSGEKLNYFLHKVVIGRLSRKGKAPQKITSSSISQYVAAITDLYRTQVGRKTNGNEHPRAIVKDLLKVQKDRDFQSKRENYEDRGEGTLADGRMKAIINQNNDPAHTLLQRSIPIVEERLRILHSDLSIRLNEQARKQDVLNDYITRLVTGQASVNLTVNIPTLNQTIRANNTIPSTATATPEAATTTATTRIPTYHMSRGIVSLTDLWRVWSEGFCGGPAVLDLERQYGTRWREDEGVKKFFLRRNAIIKVIQQYAEEMHIDMKTAVGIAEKRRCIHKLKHITGTVSISQYGIYQQQNMPVTRKISSKATKKTRIHLQFRSERIE
ncbi:transcriptional activator of glycolytic enzymes-domain-containing protein [Parasitella parasitica]|nr:transcriptional activator of glycolytic enzymes-domain-containing protein [Parasitella parasitica]